MIALDHKRFMKINENGKLNKDVVEGLKLVLKSQAFLGLIQNASKEVYKMAFEKFKPVTDDRRSKRSGQTPGEPIIDSERLYLASDEVAKNIYDYHRVEMASKGFPAPRTYCPVLVAESFHRDALHALIDQLEPFTNIGNAQLINVKIRQEYIDLTLRMLVTMATQQKIVLSDI